MEKRMLKKKDDELFQQPELKSVKETLSEMKPAAKQHAHTAIKKSESKNELQNFPKILAETDKEIRAAMKRLEKQVKA